MFRIPLAAFIPAVALLSSHAGAVCYHNGQLYAKTTLEQEFREARWVVRAKVISATDWSDNGVHGTLYRLEVITAFKGSMSHKFLFSTERNSGGFYLDRGSKPDIGGEYLLFLVPNPTHAAGPQSVRSALWVNYACGQSRSWRDVDPIAESKLLTLSSDN